LFFRHPEHPTSATFSPWHPKLEFRGHGGIVVLPPSLHKSGGRYEWIAGQHPDEVKLARVPQPIAEELAHRVTWSNPSTLGPSIPADDHILFRARRYLSMVPGAI
jgi:hypothetical protein